MLIYVKKADSDFMVKFHFSCIRRMILISGFFLFIFPEIILSQVVDSLNKADSLVSIDSANIVDTTVNVKAVNYVDESNAIYNPSIKTVLFHREGWDMSPPVLKFDSDEQLRLSFDDLDVNTKEFTFTIVHCDAGWKPSAIRQDEYIDGYYEDYIRDYSFSVSTILPYIHYDLLFPTEDLKPKIPGNYILKVYLDNPDSCQFTRRFMVVDQKVTVTGRVHQASQLEEKNYKQEVDFSFKTNGYRIINPYTDLKVTIIQNGRWDNAITNLQPKMVIGDKYDYDYDKENVFNGGNEFRAFDTKSLRYNSENIAKIDYTAEGYQVYLLPDVRRTFQVYKTIKDIDGQMKIKTDDQPDSETEAEYVYVHFTLPYPAPMMDGDIFIIGQLTDWRFSDGSKMDYNFKKKSYEKTLLLKQGYYNYQYALRYHGQQAGDASFIEGNHMETENAYTLFIYNRDFGKEYDVLIGVDYLSSKP